MSGRTVVFGGAGRTGRLVVDLLSEREPGEVVAVSRSAPGAGGHRVVGSVTDADVCRELLRDASGVVVVVESDHGGDGPNGPFAVHRDGTATVVATAPADAHIVLVSQIYITRPDAFPAAREVIRARAAGEALLRRSGHPYTVVRPAWLHDGQDTGVRLAQGDTVDGRVTRAGVAAVCVAALLDRPPAGQPSRWSTTGPGGVAGCRSSTSRPTSARHSRPQTAGTGARRRTRRVAVNGHHVAVRRTPPRHAGPVSPTRAAVPSALTVASRLRRDREAG